MPDDVNADDVGPGDVGPGDVGPGDVGPGAAPGDAADSPAPGPGSGPIPPAADTGYTEAGVPTLEGVREKIETRYGTALGHTELASETSEARAAADRYESRQQAAAKKLEQIRESMRESGQADD